MNHYVKFLCIVSVILTGCTIYDAGTAEYALPFDWKEVAVWNNSNQPFENLYIYLPAEERRQPQPLGVYFAPQTNFTIFHPSEESYISFCETRDLSQIWQKENNILREINIDCPFIGVNKSIYKLIVNQSTFWIDPGINLTEERLNLIRTSLLNARIE